MIQQQKEEGWRVSPRLLDFLDFWLSTFCFNLLEHGLQYLLEGFSIIDGSVGFIAYTVMLGKRRLLVIRQFSQVISGKYEGVHAVPERELHISPAACLLEERNIEGIDIMTNEYVIPLAPFNELSHDITFWSGWGKHLIGNACQVRNPACHKLARIGKLGKPSNDSAFADLDGSDFNNPVLLS